MFALQKISCIMRGVFSLAFRVVEGTRMSGPRLVVGGRRAPEDEVVVLGLGSKSLKMLCLVPSTRRRDGPGPGPVHGWRTWTRAWRNFQAPLPAPPAVSAMTRTCMLARDACGALSDAAPRLHSHHVTSSLSLPPSLPFFPSSTFADAHHSAINIIASAQTVRIVANNTISDGVG
jgi:hypothetical protein